MGQILMIRVNQLNFVIGPYHLYVKRTKINVSGINFQYSPTHTQALRGS